MKWGRKERKWLGGSGGGERERVQEETGSTKVATTKSEKEEKISSACLPDGRSLCPLGDKKLEHHQRVLRSGPPRAGPVDRVTSQMLITPGFFH